MVTREDILEIARLSKLYIKEEEFRKEKEPIFLSLHLHLTKAFYILFFPCYNKFKEEKNEKENSIWIYLIFVSIHVNGVWK